ncbi:dienelactone hydrolase [Paenibacillus phyllosphaerae]|uniref:Dienelactone hydrolase n=1 Tax=Paenibacillus phyllosphaerae TaxID=274593 RepID=A0A7W5B006_9BACL|nr:dienelactone hydrolase family protein [Paenibacillus phyllosphaerae]MBB3111905.1 dienelactone hydrolase [Paenibacillus phyllosphaerae]
MIRINNGSDTAVILIHEIYGVNAHMQQVSEAFAQQQYDVYGPNLLAAEEPCTYDQEAEAYANYMAHVGFTRASDRIKELIAELRGTYAHLYLVGFSVGATVAWLCSQEEGVTGVVGYYGSRIRNYLDVLPSCRTLLFFAEEEKSFDVPDVSAVLDQKPKVAAVVYRGRHGFADPYSPNYNEESARLAFRQLLAFMKS